MHKKKLKHYNIAIRKSNPIGIKVGKKGLTFYILKLLLKSPPQHPNLGILATLFNDC